MTQIAPELQEETIAETQSKPKNSASPDNDKETSKTNCFILIGEKVRELRISQNNVGNKNTTFFDIDYGWCFQNKEDAQKIAEKHSRKGKEINVQVFPIENARRKWCGSKLEKKAVGLETKYLIAKQSLDDKEKAFKNECDKKGIDFTFLYKNSLPDDFTTEQKTAFAYLKPKFDDWIDDWNKDQEACEEFKKEWIACEEEIKDNPTEDEEYKVVIELNKKHAVVHTDQFYILTEKRHSLHEGIDFTLESKQSFLNTYENKLINCSDGKTRNKARIWLSHEKRRQYHGITFDPTTLDHKNGLYNIWKGFPFTPIKGCCKKFKDHIRDVICSKNQEYFNYVWSWLAHLVQKPNELSPVLVLMGEQGTGKNTFVDPIGEIFGMHYLPLDNINQFLGNFNFHLKNAVLIHGNEAVWGGNKQALGKLKAMVTEKDCVIEGKGKDQIRMRNFKHLILSSNEDWPVHLERDARRFLVLNISNIHKDDRPYFVDIRKELANGGLQAILYDLLNENISDFNPWLLPQNAEAFAVKMMSASSPEKYIYEALFQGTFDIGNETPSLPWNNTILCSSVYSDYSIWCQRQGLKAEANQRFGNALHKLTPSINKERGTTGTRPYHYELPSLNKTREEFQKSFNADPRIWKKQWS